MGVFILVLLSVCVRTVTACNKEQHSYTYNASNMVHGIIVYLVKRSHYNYIPVDKVKLCNALGMVCEWCVECSQECRSNMLEALSGACVLQL